ncbi:MAG: hypothetical protein R2682_13850, partial [Pyrinomonadaceae bacterium]
MRIVHRALLVSIALFTAFACSAARSEAGSTSEPVNAAPTAKAPEVATGAVESPAEPVADPVKEPKTIREFFMLLPTKYFNLESCEAAKDKGCRKAKQEYLKTFLEIEDTANGYLKASCDGAQSCLEMAIFKKPDGSYLIGLRSDFEMGSDSYFIDYNKGAWNDVGKKIVEGFSKDNFYAFPRNGTTVEVFEKLSPDTEPTSEVGKGRKLYDLEWKGGKFMKKK